MATAFYGISFNITGFGLNIYLTQFTYALIEVPAKVSVYYLWDTIGRRRTEVGSLLMVGVCLGINIVVPKGKNSSPMICISASSYLQTFEQLQEENSSGQKLEHGFNSTIASVKA